MDFYLFDKYTILKTELDDIASLKNTILEVTCIIVQPPPLTEQALKALTKSEGLLLV